MIKRQVEHYIDSVFYSMEHAVVYFKLKGAQCFKDLGLEITIDQFAALDAIYCHDDICQRDLSKIILKDRSNTGRILNILEKDGYITRELETKGKRPVKKVYITEKGRKLVEEVVPQAREAFTSVFQDFKEEEFDNLRDIIARLKESMSKITTIQI
jgi:DNA-binding MarR family transcriptional regulator